MGDEVTKSKGKGKGKKIGRCSRKLYHQLYKSSKQRERNKLKRVFQSNGLQAAQDYAAKHSIRFSISESKINKRKGTQE